MAESRQPVRPIVAFLTDFGTHDHYVGAMKGAVLSVCRDAALVDITHEVPPQDVLWGALELGAAYRFFPQGTIFVAVVDPGVGSARRAIAVEAGPFRFVAPDNGILTAVLNELPAGRIVELTDPRYVRDSVSRTFEGRDRFAPAAGWLANGLAIASLGRALPECQRLDIPKPEIGPDRVRGSVLRVDRFGNLITNLPRQIIDDFAGGAVLSVAIGDHMIAGIVATYAAAGEGEVCALFGSNDVLEIAVRDGNAASRLRLGRGAPVTLTRV